MTNSIEIQGLVKGYSAFTLGPVDLAVPAGAIVGLIGENGAGKTTLLKCLLDIARPNEGTVQILGRDSRDRKAREDVGVVLDECLFHDTLLARDVDKILSKVYRQWDRALFASLLQRLNLPADRYLKEFSRGMKMKLSLAAALAHHPSVLVLDEATSGLDPVVRDELLDELMAFSAQGEHSILMSSHITTDLEKAADYIAYLHQGQLLFFEEKDRLLEDHGRLVCTRADLAGVDPAYVLAVRQGQWSTEALIRDKAAFRRRYPRLTVDPVALDEIMVFMERGTRS